MQLPTILVSVLLTLVLAVSLPERALAATEDISPGDSSETASHPAPQRDRASASQEPLRGVHFNPRIDDGPGRPWLVHYPECRARIREALHELASTTCMNMVVIYVMIPHSLRDPSQAPRADQPFSEWANTDYLDNVAAFVDDCHEVGLAVELDLACNLWMPYSVDPETQIANSGRWPMPGETPWEEAAVWYRETINYIEGKAKHPENIALWVMTGHYQLGAAEPVLWPDDSNPAVLASAEKFVKHVWPVFISAGERPKGAPFMFGIFSNDPYWMPKSPDERLAGFYNLKKWIVDDLPMPPDYWLFTAYPLCDPAPDGFHYLRTIMDILGRENASRIIATDLKGPGHEPEYEDTVLSVDGFSGPELLEWHFRKFEEYGIRHWWIWAYQDIPGTAPWAESGIRSLDGEWKMDLVDVIREQSGCDQ